MKTKRVATVAIICSLLLLAGGLFAGSAIGQQQSAAGAQDKAQGSSTDMSNQQQAQQAEQGQQDQQAQQAKQGQQDQQAKQSQQGQQVQQASQEQPKQQKQVAVTEGTQLYVSPSTLQMIQKQLNVKGFYAGRVDGMWGNQTAQALTKFQQVQGLEPTGNLNIETLNYLGVAQALQRGATWKNKQLAGEGAPLYVSPSSVRQVQQQLSSKGVNPGPIDGLYGPNTKAAVQKFEKKEGMQASGNINVQMLSSLGLNRMIASLTEKEAQAMQPGQQQMAQAQQQGQQQVRGYYGPQGQTEQQQRMTGQQGTGDHFFRIKGRQEQAFAGEGAPLFVSVATVQQIQDKLKQAGYQPGNTNGKWDGQTSQAIRQYQKAKGLEATGNLNISTMNEMLGGLRAELQQQGGSQGQQQSR